MDKYYKQPPEEICAYFDIDVESLKKEYFKSENDFEDFELEDLLNAILYLKQKERLLKYIENNKSFFNEAENLLKSGIIKIKRLF